MTEKTYRQITHKLRIYRGPGRGEKVSERPRGKNGAYQDSEENPTLITLDEYDQVDVTKLLAAGIIAEYRPPKPPKAKPQGEEVEDVGKDSEPLG